MVRTWSWGATVLGGRSDTNFTFHIAMGEPTSRRICGARVRCYFVR